MMNTVSDVSTKVARREETILSALRGRGELNVDALSALLGVGPATVRRDLGRLAQRGSVTRTYGGAVPADGRSNIAIPNVKWKRLIGAEAAHLVQDGQSVVISSGTTTIEFARRLSGRRLTVITNTLDVADVLVDEPSIELIVLGGVVRKGMRSLLGHLTDLAAGELRADLLVMGIPAISLDHGLMSDYMPEILTDRALRRMVRDVVVLADATKFRQLAPAFVFRLEDVSTIVTDERIAPETVKSVEGRGVRVVVARDRRPATEGGDTGSILRVGPREDG